MDSPAMQRLRGFLRICFGYLTLICTIISGFMLASLYWMAQHPHHYHYTYKGQRRLVLSVTLIALSRLVRVVPILMAIVYGTAWWTLKQGRRSARRWAIAASAVMVLSSGAMVFSRLVLWPAGHFRSSFLLFQIFFFATGILGLIVFTKTAASSIEAQAQPAHVRGDGTSSILDLAVSALALAGMWGGMILYSRWGSAQHLPANSVSLGVIALVILVTVLLHEAAHAGVGIALGMRLRAFAIGPFQWRIRDGRWTYLFVPSGFLSFGGSTGVVPSKQDQSRWNEIAMIAAGPLVNLGAGALAGLMTVTAKDRPWERFWEPLAFFATVNLVTCAVNCVPFRPEALYSDGARIYQLLAGGPWALLHRVYSMVLSSTVSPMRPRNYDLEAILRAEAHFTHGREALLLHLFATSHYIDTGKLAEARAGFAEVLRIYQETQPRIPGDLLTTFVFNSVYLNRNASEARRFWDLYESKSPTHFGMDYWLARAALHWIENDNLEARDAWATGNTLAAQLPEAGAYNFDRDRYGMLRELMESTPATASDLLRAESKSHASA
jgi:hypothetical protein